MTLAETHPRPQMTRPAWVDLCGSWDFAYDDANVGLDERWQDRADAFDRTIVVPFPPESPASGIGDPGYHPYLWYRRTFEVPGSDRPGRVLLHFGAVDYRAHVWVNGHLVATHEGGHTPFSADITPALVDGEQVVVVRAEDNPHDLSQPRGKQDWQPEPHDIWYNRTTGIWQPVWIELVPSVYISRLQWTPDLQRGTLTLDVRLGAEPPHPFRLRVRLSLNGQELADETARVSGSESRLVVALDNGAITMGRKRTLWSPEYPNLIDATIDLLDGDAVIDTVGSYAGLRSCGIADGSFTLNGNQRYLRLVLAQNYWPESHLAAPSPEAIRREVELIRELGFNGIRIHQKVADPRFLYWCDRLGVMVWSEMANAFTFSPDAVTRFTREWMEVVERDRSHPCIITWVPFNESWGVPNLEGDASQRAYVRALYHLTKALDPTRPVIGNDGWEHVVGDIRGIHDYSRRGDVLRERYGSREAVERTINELRPHYRAIGFEEAERDDRPIMLTEFGGISYAPADGERWYGYGTVTTSDEFLAKYDELLSAIQESPVIAGFCYTQLTDTVQETNGLLTERRLPKLDPEAICAINTRPSQAVAGEISNEMTHAAQVTALQGND